MSEEPLEKSPADPLAGRGGSYRLGDDGLLAEHDQPAPVERAPKKAPVPPAVQPANE